MTFVKAVKLILTIALILLVRKLMWCLRWLWCYYHDKPLPREISWIPGRSGGRFERHIQQREEDEEL